MSRRGEFDQGHAREHVVAAERIHAILPDAEVTFRHGGSGLNHHLSVATRGKEHIPGAGEVGGVQHGSMLWGTETGEIKGILVEGKAKRRGVATAMLHTARELAQQHGIASPVHSTKQTDEGAAWAAKAP